MLRIVLIVIFTLFPASAMACVALPSSEQREKALRALINEAHHVFIGQVWRVTRRRWGPDDQKNRYLKDWEKWDAEGREVPVHVRNMMDFSDASARLKVLISLQETSIEEDTRSSYFSEPSFIPIDLLRPFTQFGYGPCFNFPRTCPWNVKVGEFVAVAIKRRFDGSFAATYCLRTDLPSHTERKEIEVNRKTWSADRMFWPYVEAAQARQKQ
ncbi:MAG: hypothetical protein MPJ78_01505 [Hyphomicrobiaceae bacterium]|nr:hypothetical protein [Hyphomicrobiaceae bacterium]